MTDDETVVMVTLSLADANRLLTNLEDLLLPAAHSSPKGEWGFRQIAIVKVWEKIVFQLRHALGKSKKEGD